MISRRFEGDRQILTLPHLIRNYDVRRDAGVQNGDDLRVIGNFIIINYDGVRIDVNTQEKMYRSSYVVQVRQFAVGMFGSRCPGLLKWIVRDPSAADA